VATLSTLRLKKLARLRLFLLPVASASSLVYTPWADTRAGPRPMAPLGTHGLGKSKPIDYIFAFSFLVSLSPRSFSDCRALRVCVYPPAAFPPRNSGVCSVATPQSTGGPYTFPSSFLLSSHPPSLFTVFHVCPPKTGTRITPGLPDSCDLRAGSFFIVAQAWSIHSYPQAT